MEALWFSLKQLHIILIGFGVMLGLLSGREVLGKLGKMAVLTGVFIHGGGALQAVWADLPFGTRLLALGIGLPVAAVALLAWTSFGREVLASMLGDALYDGLRLRGCTIGCLPLLILLVILLALLS